MDESLRRLNDREEIRDLIHDYCSYVDRYEPEKVGALFTEDCVTNYGEAFGGEVLGNALVARGCAYALAGWIATSHHVSNIRLEFEDDDRARGTSYLYAWHRHDDDRPDFEIWARYLDVFVRTPAGWRFQERRIEVAGQRGDDHDFPGIGRRTPDPALVEKVRKRRAAG